MVVVMVAEGGAGYEGGGYEGNGGNGSEGGGYQGSGDDVVDAEFRASED
jgi:hypothetical protein